MLVPYIASVNILLLSEGVFEWGENRGDSHTFDLIKLFTYPHMPPGPFAGHMKDGPGQRRERGRGRALLGPGIRREKVQWHAGRKSASDQQGLANQSVRREASCSFWPERKEPRSRWCSPVPAVLQRRGKKGEEEEEEDDDERNSPNVSMLLHYFWTSCFFFFLPGTYCVARRYYA